MQRQRGELVPIGDALADLGGPVKAIRDATPQALHHFTRFDQVNQLVGASEADPDLGFMARLLVLCSLPRTNPGNRKEYVRRNGPYKLGDDRRARQQAALRQHPTVIDCLDLHGSGADAKARARSRPLALRVHAEARNGRSQREHSGRPSAAPQSDESALSLHSFADLRGRAGDASVSSLIARRTEFWWNEHKPGERMLWESKIELGEDFFNEIIRHPVPLDMNTLKALKRCSLGLDLYLWLNYRTFALRAPLRLTWKQLYRQFGLHPSKASDKQTVKNFRRKVLRELVKIKVAWPGLNYTTAPGVLILHPSAPAIPPAEQQLSLVG